MVESDLPEFATAIGAMLETFGQQATKPILHGYWLGLNDLPLASVQRAIAIAIARSERTLRPFDPATPVRRASHRPASYRSWGDVLKAVPVGYYKHVDFADRLINAAIRNLGGWPSLLDRFDGANGGKWARHELLKAYTAIGAGRVNAEVCAPLPGLSQETAIEGVLRTPVSVRFASDTDTAYVPGSVRRRAIAKPLKMRANILYHSLY